MDIAECLSEYFDQVLRVRSAYDLADAADLCTTVAEAEAVLCLSVRLREMFVAQGFTPSPAAAAQLKRDRALLSEADDESASSPIAPPTEEEWAIVSTGATQVPSNPGDGDTRTRQPSQSSGDMRTEVEQMRKAITARATIEQAKGIVMERYGLTSEAAWSQLVRQAHHDNVKLRTLADNIVATVATPANAKPG